MKEYFSYYDAIEETGEVVYCGKGNGGRISHFRRNRYYNNIKKKHKLVRTVIPMLDEDLALKYEDWLMEYYHTWVDDPQATEHACNIDGPGTNGGSKSLSKETKNLISNQTKEAMSDGFMSFQYEKVIQLTMNFEYVNTYDGIFIAAKILNLKSGANISSVCKGKLLHSGGYRWMYEEDYKKFLETGEHNLKLRNKEVNEFKKSTVTQKPVYKIDRYTDKILDRFNSITEAKTSTGVCGANISECLHERRKTAGGYKWSFC